MTSLIPARRAAEEFARVVDGLQVDVADRYSDLTDCVEMLRAQETPAPRAEFVADLRTRLMAAADTALVPAASSPRPVTSAPETRRRRQRHLGVAVAALAMVGGTAGVAAAAESALPGDPLYPVKRGIESARVSLSSNDSAKGNDLISQAGTRLDEVDALIDQGDSTSEVSDTLSSFQRSATEGADLLFVTYQRDGDVEDLASLRGVFAEQLTQLQALSRQAPATLQAEFAQAIALLSDLDQQARVLCGDCGPGSGSAFTDLTSAPALTSLLTEPAAAALAAAQAERTQELAEKADKVAENTPQAPAPTPLLPTGPGSQPSGGGTPIIQVPTLPTQDGSLRSTVEGVTGGVQGLLDEVSAATGGLTTPLTDSLNSTLDTVTNLLLP